MGSLTGAVAFKKVSKVRKGKSQINGKLIVEA